MRAQPIIALVAGGRNTWAHLSTARKQRGENAGTLLVFPSFFLLIQLGTLAYGKALKEHYDIVKMFRNI